ncbi:hypothetical protein GGX14DRAFT_401972 [Mycena pura]|uniref:Transmembrane protein n=1 Tax=Mycena pura TaxID=153505 RepID=A0AAD6UYH1_9AGAR|nr:hypothetical protein GGX14DRAFT_401972 [Mycena pura]
MAHSLFPSSAWQALIAAHYFIGITALTFFFSRRMLGDETSTRQALTRLTWPRVCTLLIFLDSYLFVFASGLLIFGVGLQLNSTACAAGIYLCVLFYATSKVLIYAFLTEKVYIVWDTGRSRKRSPVYLVCIITVCMYSAVVIGMIIGRVQQFRPGDGACVIGLERTSSIPLLSYDLFINVLLTALFLWPLLRSKHSSPRLRRVAIRTMVASAVALTTSTVNIAVLTVMHGRQLGWVCLASCGGDVLLNASALFWVTGGARDALSGNRQLSDSTSAPGASTPGGLAALGVQSGTGRTLKDGGLFRMSNLTGGMLSPGREFRKDLKAPKEFQIRVTTESQVSRSPPAPADQLYKSDSDLSAKTVVTDDDEEMQVK